VRILRDAHGRVGSVELARNELVPDDSGALRARATEQRETIDVGLVFRAIGYRGLALPGVPYDERRGVIPNQGGRVTDPASGAAHPREYVVGWIKRGPTGVIGTNKKDAQQTVDAILADLAARGNGSAAADSPQSADAESVLRLLMERKPDLVPYEGWREIDRHERSRGEPQGRPRVKLTRIDEMLRVAAAEQPSDGE
jgi:ferredoxin/flavodoxin---NADP+ reductase